LTTDVRRSRVAKPLIAVGFQTRKNCPFVGRSGDAVTSPSGPEIGRQHRMLGTCLPLALNAVSRAVIE
jgi:hypothetical protein